MFDAKESSLNKLDMFLGLPAGTSVAAIVSHCPSHEMNEKLASHGITLDGFGMVPKNQRRAWAQLMQKAGVSERYWKTGTAIPEAKVTDLTN